MRCSRRSFAPAPSAIRSATRGCWRRSVASCFVLDRDFARLAPARRDDRLGAGPSPRDRPRGTQARGVLGSSHVRRSLRRHAPEPHVLERDRASPARGSPVVDRAAPLACSLHRTARVLDDRWPARWHPRELFDGVGDVAMWLRWDERLMPRYHSRITVERVFLTL
jgi:hypothetical protein